ncbi:MAG TPA: hypothetical protein DCG75_12015 [Bacteroidales bacterium]|nr:hypothetical protein [Bacteroidales bacterium]
MKKKKEKIKLRYPDISDEGLCFRLGKEENMLEILSYKLGKSKEELVEILDTLERDHSIVVGKEVINKLVLH